MDEKNNFLLLKLLRLCWKKEKKYLIILILLLIPKIIFPFIILLSLQKILNLIELNKHKDFLMIIGVVYFLSLILSKIFNIFFEYIQGLLKVRLNFNVNSYIIEKSLELNLKDYENSKTYDTLQKVLQETQTPYQSIMNIFNLINNIITFIGSIFIFILWKWYLVIILLIFPVISFYFTILISKYEFKVAQEKISNTRKLSYYRLLLNDISSYKDNKILDSTEYLYEKFKFIFNLFIQKDKKILQFFSINTLIFQMLETLLGIIIIYLIFQEFISKKIFIGSVYMYINCIWNITKTSDALINNISEIFNKSQYLKILFEFIDINRNNIIKRKELIKLNSIETIEFKNLSFRYKKEGPFILKNINLKVKKNEKIVIIGNNGSGKSTFIKLLCGFYSDYEGEILFNGISLKEIDKKSLYKKMGVVFQDFVKYEFSLEENLKMGNFQIKYEEMIEYINFLKMNGIMEFIDKNKLNINVQLGHKFDNGIELSGGEWQQLSFSRAMLKNADLFIMDEPSSGLDIFAEKSMYNVIGKKGKNSICFIVTHRLYIIDKDIFRAVVFKDGSIIEDDKISKLLRIDSVYKKMFDELKLKNSENEINF